MVRELAPPFTLLLCFSLAGPSSAEAGSDDTPSPEALVGEFPFHPESPPSRVMIDLAAEGSPAFVMMLDTGASTSVITPRYARWLGVSVRRDKSTPYRRMTRLGRDVQFWVDDIASDTASSTGYEYGLLGADFFDDYVLEIDYPGRVVRFYDPEKYVVPETTSDPAERVLPFRRAGTRILVEFEVEGTTVLTLLDTGAPSVGIDGREAKKLKIDWEKLPELEGVGGTVGPIKTYTYQAQKIRFGGFEFPSQPIDIYPRGAYNQGASMDSVLGYDILGHFMLRIDSAQRRILLRRGPAKEVTYWGRRADGAELDSVAASRFVTTPLAPPKKEEVVENDARIAADFERGKAIRRYAETSNGHFVVVDGYRLRQGPKAGEVWYTHEEMLARQQQSQKGDAKNSK